MALSKDKHYWTQLRTVITSGQWDAALPAKAPNGALLSWSELLRKFNKHCPGSQDFAEVSSQTQALSLLLGAGSVHYGSELDGHACSSKGGLDLGDECVLPEERWQEAEAGYKVLKDLPQSESTSLALAYHAYALSRPSECILILEQVKDIADPQSRTLISKSNASALNVPTGAADHSSSSSWTGSFVSSEAVVSTPDIRDGRAWALTESIRSICLLGMSHEKMHPENLEEPFKVYSKANTLLSSLESEIPRSVPTTPTGTSLSSFTQYRELWRWVDRLLWRKIVIAARISTDDQVLLALFQQYQACSAHWISTFRPEHRSVVAVLHLHFFISRASSSNKFQSKHPSWLSGARSVIQDYRSVLSSSTNFPSAGERNVKVEDFLDLCVAVWEASGAVGEHAGWVVDILWWATRLTFNSYRVFRHMARLFYVSGDFELAKRTLRLYTQVVGKAWQTANAESPQSHDEGNSEIENGDNNVDTDENWVETLVQGSRMLCRLSCTKSGTVLGSTGNGMEEAKEAGQLLQKAKTRLDVSDAALVASLDLAEGIWNAVMAYKEQDSLTRPHRLLESLRLCRKSVDTNPTASGYYHLALALARAGPERDIDQAIENARAAVEQDPTAIRHWHLLGILLVGTDDWRKAKGVLDYGAAIGDHKSEEDETLDGLPRNDSSSAIEGLPSTHNSLTVKPIHPPLLERDASQIPESFTLLQPLPDHPPPSRRELFEESLQLRMTQLALSEYAEGPEGAVEKWLEVFQWVSEYKDLATDDSRRSVDSGRPSAEAQSISNQTVPAHGRPSIEVTDYAIKEESIAETLPITITPASPSLQTHFFEKLPTESSEDGKEVKRSSSGRNRAESSAGKKVSKMLKSQVHRGQERISSISKIMGNKSNQGHLRRTSSAPDIHSLLGQHAYQASSIHSRKRLKLNSASYDAPPLDSTPPPPAPPPPATQTSMKWDSRVARERRLLSDLWSMSAATFRRLGKIEQARGAIQEAEVRDENNPAVWVQLGLYYSALGDELRALQALHKALFITPENASATIHLCRIYLSPKQSNAPGAGEFDPDRVDLAAGMLSDLTNGDGWDIPEAWYFLAKAYKMQGRNEKERECLSVALGLAEMTRVRQIADAVGWCL